MRTAMVLACFLALSLAPAWAQRFAPADPNDGMQAARDQIMSEIRGAALPGPRPGEQRIVWVWRPHNAPTADLPVLYMFDGLDGLRVALLRLKPAFDSGALPPIIIVAPESNAHGERRGAEYLRGFPGGADDFRAHEQWFITQVMPWAQSHGAASDRSRVFIGGFSNGADLALTLASDHPDLFGGALIHSPVGAQADWVSASAPTQRWVVSGGTDEDLGSVHVGADAAHHVITALHRNGAPYRQCLGRWRHEGPVWRDLSPGSLVWLMGLGDFAAYETPPERVFCRNAP